MAKSRPEKKRERKDNGQLPLPPSREPALAATRVLPMQLQVGDRLTDETAEWEIIGRAYTTNMGKNAHVRVRRVDQPDVTDMWTWSAHERISVKRASADEGRR